MFIVEIHLSFRRRGITCVIAIRRNVGEHFRSNSGPESKNNKLVSERIFLLLIHNQTLTQLKHTYSSRRLRVEARCSQLLRRRVICHLDNLIIKSRQNKKAIATYQATNSRHRSKQGENQHVECSSYCRSQLDKHDHQLLKSTSE